MSRIPVYQPGVDARQRLRVLLRLPGVRSSAQAQGRGLLRVLLVWYRALPAEANRGIFLTDGLRLGVVAFIVAGFLTGIFGRLLVVGVDSWPFRAP